MNVLWSVSDTRAVATPFYPQKFDIITQKPKKGHIFEVEFKPKLKPPSLVTANHTDYDIISTRKFEEHHWAPPGRRRIRCA